MRVEPQESHAYDFARQGAQRRRRRSANGNGPLSAPAHPCGRQYVPWIKEATHVTGSHSAPGERPPRRASPARADQERSLRLETSLKWVC